MKELKVLNPENASEEEIKKYPTREASRAVVTDEDGLIALLYVFKKNYYKLPGGGIEEGEDKIEALQRECLEEIGGNIEIINEIGSIVEYRKIFNIQQISYCYLAKLKGPKGTPSLEAGEIEEGFKEVWLSYEDALEALTESQATDIEGSGYIVPRDTLFLEEAQEYLSR